MLKKNLATFLDVILQSKETQVEKLVLLLEKSRKQFWYELSLLNQELEAKGYRPIKEGNGKLIISPEDFKNMAALVEVDIIDLYQLQEERIYFLYLFIACQKDFIANIHLQQFLQLSRNAVMLDLKKMRKWLAKSAVTLEYDRTDGYLLLGNERSVRELMEVALSKLRERLPLDKVLTVFEQEWGQKQDLDQVSQLITMQMKQAQLLVVQDRLEAFIYLIIFIKQRAHRVRLQFSDDECALLKEQLLFPISQNIVQAIFQTDSEAEVFFWESRLLGITQGIEQSTNQAYFNKLTDVVLMNVSVMIGVNYHQLRTLKQTLYQHIVPAYFRIKFNVYYENALLTKIKKEYAELFQITKRALQPLEKATGQSISESEIAYFTIHFGGYLRNNNKSESLKALVVCPNGISSSLIMVSTVREIFPEIDIVRTHSLEGIEAVQQEEIDLIFSTTYFWTDKKIYVINPILNPVEREVLREQVGQDFPSLPRLQPIQTHELVKIIERHGQIRDKHSLINDLQQYLYKRREGTKRGMMNLTDILNPSLINVLPEVSDWRAAIKEAASPLLAQAYIKDEYVTAMIETVENLGPYIVLAPKVAVAHARPERGVNKLGISLLKLNNSVNFNLPDEDDPERHVQLVFVLAAVDGNAHLKALMQLSKIIEEEENIEALITMDKPEQLYNSMQALIRYGEEQE
ncbi:PTS system, ascorbate-specific IIA component [Amphibacillus marinus]|uniref:Ascorbate-specific PTS system EIIA component n=1 Tax=Amphibacillus marinus TaxID=872970 RepID=A0A1H8MWG9_9BACI|nr:BglG family transcription antiterminator [Amphibacillus marinus]SEO21629.1 PTS system, ascorbate-specific IIA component [Amphibacillus marinus]